MVYYAGNLRFYLSALEEECCKIEVFRRELPLCYEVVTQTIEAWKQKMVEKDGVVECDLALSEDQTLPGRPVLEEFIPLRDDTGGDNNREERKGLRRQRKIESDREEKKKSEWLRSAQLWNPIPDLNAHEDEDDDEDDSRPVIPEKPPKGINLPAPEIQEHQGRGDHKTSGKLTSSPADSSTSCGGIGKGEEKQQARHSQRKQRRCWSSELHRRFLNALEDLGGQQVATPKQIKERMKIDGLTNDEIKSHLQKYRLHTKQSPPAQDDTAPVQAPQLVVVGGIWVPPPDFTPVAGSVSLPPTNKIYAPVATILKTSPALSSSAYTITIP